MRIPPIFKGRETFLENSAPSVQDSASPIPEIKFSSQNSTVSVLKLWSSIAFRFGGLASFEALIDPVCGPTSPTVARIFFREKLQSVVALAEKSSASAIRTIEARTDPAMPLWGLLLRVACGDSRATLLALNLVDSGRFDVEQGALIECAVEVAKIRSLEGAYLLRQIYARADTTDRLRVIKAFVENEQLGSNSALSGELFVQLMARSTPAERGEEIYPALTQILGAETAGSAPCRGFLKALFAGWLSECPQSQGREKNS